MHYSWDPAKSERNRAVRGFDFEHASLIFSGPWSAQVDRRRDYGEVRTLAIGRADGACLTVVFTDRIAADGALERRIISARRSNRREVANYEAVTSQETESRPSGLRSHGSDDG